MITIPVRIKREDLEIMVTSFEWTKDYLTPTPDLTILIIRELSIEILAKMRAAQYNSSTIRLNLVQTKFFLSYLENQYAKIGIYEMANAIALKEEMLTEMYKKVVKINHKF